MRFNPITGEELSAPQKLDYTPVKFIHLPEVESHPYPSSSTTGAAHPPHTTVVLTVDSEGHLWTFPESHEAREYVHKYPYPIFYYLHDTDAGSVSGYAVQMWEEGSTYKPTENLVSFQIWKKKFSPAFTNTVQTVVEKKDGKISFMKVTEVVTTKPRTVDSEQIIEITHNKINTHGPARVVGDSAVLWKYLNPHSIVVATSQKGNKDTDSSITIYVIDVISGRLLTSQVQKYALPPFHMLSSDNYIVYDYWCAKTHTTQVTVMDFYYTTSGWDRHVSQTKTID